MFKQIGVCAHIGHMYSHPLEEVGSLHESSVLEFTISTSYELQHDLQMKMQSTFHGKFKPSFDVFI
jgi:hypothetical protein